MDGDKRYWLDEPGNVTKLVWGFTATCALLLLAEAFYERHAEFAFESWFGFYAGFGFVMCVGLVMGATWMRTFLKRREDYYDG
jgi:hypothetical protein